MNKRFLTFLIFLSLIFFPLMSEERIVLGEGDQWQGAYLKDLRLREGREGFLDMEVAHQQSPLTAKSDFYFPFDQNSSSMTPYYRVETNHLIQQDFQRLGEGTALFEDGKTLTLHPQRGSLFYPYSHWEDFTLSFWLYPAVLEEGEVLMQWKGFLQTRERILSQEMVCRIQGRKLTWDFHNFFLSPQNEESHFQLKGDSLIPRKWSHHMIRYRYDIGQLEYLIDGDPVAITYTTPSGREEAEVLQPKIEQSRPTPILFGSRFTGFLDELLLTREWSPEPVLLDYEKPGYFVTPILDFQYQDSRILDLQLLDRTEGNSRIQYYYRLFNRWEDAQDGRSSMMDLENPEAGLDLWKPFSPGDDISDRGRYLLVAGVLYPDIGKEISPAMSRIIVDYEEHLPPVPPLNLRAVVVDEGIELRWDYSEKSGIQGFLIYYGDRPGRYFGPGSPIEVFSPDQVYLLEGLDKYKTWYISMVAYNSSSPPQYSDFSREVAIRP